MNYIYWLSQIHRTEQSLVGNQLYILSQLLQHDYPVLPGFVIGNDLLRQFLTNSDDFRSLIRELSDSSFNLDLSDHLNLQSVASRSRQIINQSNLPQALEQEIFQATKQLNSDCLILQPFFSSPSGEDTADRGLWRSHTCNVHPQALTQTIKAVWSELFAANSLVYRNSLGLGGRMINLNVLVRPLNKIYASGIVEITPDLIRIKAIWGHGQSLLQGDVESDQYYLDLHTGKLLSAALGHKNYGYRIKKGDRLTPLIDCLEAYIPEGNQTEASVLSENAIAKLWQLTHKIRQKQPQVKYFLWTALKSKADSSLDFFITELGKHLLTSIDLFSKQTTPVLLSSTKVEPLLTGIPAAPGKVIAETVVIKDTDLQSQTIPADSILVIKSITPQQVLAIANAKGIITETGGKTSHGAIVARELNIPAIVNATDATNILTNGIEVFLDGDEGTVYTATAAQELPLPDSTDFPSPHLQTIATKLMVNISQPQSIPSILNLPIDGVGLLRSELMLASILGDKSPLQWRSLSFQAEFSNTLVESLRQFLAALAPRPVFYRSLDLRSEIISSSDGGVSDGGSPPVSNPILGNRGTYNYQLDRTLFSLELEALSAISNEGHSNLNLILPFVRSVEEFKFCYGLLEYIGLTKKESFQVWIMAEVPSVIWLLPEYIKAGVQGIAIGTNDLTQLLLGIDREQAHFSQYGLNANHIVVQKAIAQLIAVAREHQIECCICGQATVDYPDLIEKLVGWGITAISVEPQAVEQTHQAIARAERKILLDSLIK